MIFLLYLMSKLWIWVDWSSSQPHWTYYAPQSPYQWGKLLWANEENLTSIGLKRHVRYILAGLVPGFESLSAKEKKLVTWRFYEEVRPSSQDNVDIPEEEASVIGKIFLNDALQDELRLRFEQILAHTTKNTTEDPEKFPQYMTKSYVGKLAEFRKASVNMNAGEVKNFWSFVQRDHKNWFICTTPNSLPHSREYLIRSKYLEEIFAAIREYSKQVKQKRVSEKLGWATGSTQGIWRNKSGEALYVHTGWGWWRSVRLFD